MGNSGQEKQHTLASLFQTVQLFDSLHTVEVEGMSAIQ